MATTIAVNSEGVPVEVTEKEIDPKALEQRKVALQAAIASLPVYKDKPDEETLGFYNAAVKRQLSKLPEIEKQIADIEQQLRTIDEQMAIFKAGAEPVKP